MNNKNNKKNIKIFPFLKTLWFLIGLSKERKKFFLMLIVLSLIYLYELVPPIFIGKLIDFLTDYQKGDSLNGAFILIGLLVVLTSLISYVRLSIKKYIAKTRNIIICEIRVQGFQRIMNSSLLGESESTGSKVQKIQNGIEGLVSFSHLFTNQILSVISLLIGVIVVFLFLDFSFIVFIFAYIVIFSFIVYVFKNKIQKLNEKVNIIKEKATGSFVEGISNVLSIKALGAKKSFGGYVAKKEKQTRVAADQIVKAGIVQWQVYQVFNAASLGVFLLLIIRSIFTNQISIGDLVIFYSYFEKTSNASNTFLSFYTYIIEAATKVERLNSIFKIKEKKQNQTKSFPKNWKKIEIKNGFFAYRNKDKKAKKHDLANINLEIKKYQKIGIVGESGSGKSTIAKILLGLYDLDNGRYLIENQNFYDIKENEILNKISIVLQEPEMFNLSLKDNITLKNNFEPKHLSKVIKIAQLNEIIKKLPEGIETKIGEKGYHLSGGERQRVGIARAILKNSPIIIFDEASSSLDKKTESRIQDNLEKKLNKKTLIFIAHRVSTLENVDKIIVLDKGEIVEKGKFKELSANKKSKFYKIYKSQNK